MRVRGQIAGCANGIEEIEQDVCMTGAGVDEDDLRADDPRPDTRAGTLYVKRMLQESLHAS